MRRMESLAPLDPECERVLIVEDRYLLASELAREVERLGGAVVGSARNLAQAADLEAALVRLVRSGP
jgi:hypothetical protein